MESALKRNTEISTTAAFSLYNFLVYNFVVKEVSEFALLLIKIYAINVTF